ncbi:MAG: SAM-dependent methyltransferase [Chloroflexi bacterium HGW-Chloroflexi-8]|nr:MAG: SAM-dependent methyltransferase [Chloroflexi bacterium HGW-Chloroflexi-8]
MTNLNGTSKSFDELIKEAISAHFSGWDFSFMKNRYLEGDPIWDYRQIVVSHLPDCMALLDMGTGGGEFLSMISELPPFTAATEAWLPNLEIAHQRLSPLGIVVSFVENDHNLPFPDEQFDRVINRHESYSPGEVMRILQPGGIFITQQVGGKDNDELNQFLAPGIPFTFESWNLESAVTQLQEEGFEILEQKTCRINYEFLDIGAVVYYLKVCEWQIPGFSIDKYHDRLLALHQHIQDQGGFASSGERFLIIARKYNW